MTKDSNYSPVRRFGLLLLLVAPAVLAQGTLEVITLQHRTADQVIPILRPLVEPGGALSGQYNQLIVRTSAENLAQIRAALDAIDRPLRRLQILVRFDSMEDVARRDVQGAVRLNTQGNSSAAIRMGEQGIHQDERVDQRVQVLEGGHATIGASQSRPLHVRQVIQTPSGPVVRDTTEFQDASTGFEVVPRISGSSVILEIAPQRENFAPGRPGVVQGERIASTVSGRLGEWFELGGTGSASARSESGPLSSRDRAVSGDRRIWVKVEEIR